MSSKQFKIPDRYRSIGVKLLREKFLQIDPRRQSTKPVLLNFDSFRLLVPRNFGFCFGVQNAVEIAFRALEENKGRRLYFLSEMIHNPDVNNDLKKEGIDFLYDTKGNELIPIDTLTTEDVILVPAFGTTVEMEEDIQRRGLKKYYYDTTCPFVAKVWKRAHELGKQGYTIVVHGKRQHEETRATASHARRHAKVFIIEDYKEAQILSQYLKNDISEQQLWDQLPNSAKSDFIPQEDLKKFGLVNQTTMLASDTQKIMDLLKEAAESSERVIGETRDTLCYATEENQSAALSLIEYNPDLAFVIGGQKSSNTSHLVEILEPKMKTFFIQNKDSIKNESLLEHFDLSTKSLVPIENWIPNKVKPLITLHAGASCPDRIVDGVIEKLREIYKSDVSFEDALNQLEVN